METNQTTLPAMPEQLTKELERLNSFAYQFTYLAVNEIRYALLSIASDLHIEFGEDQFFQNSQPANS